MAGPKIIKRYANRKLYDTERSCYVTLDDIAAMIREGEEVRVVDNRTSDDLTSVTLAQIIFEAEKKRSFMSMGLLRDLIQQSGETLRDGVDKVQAKAVELRETAGKLRSDLESRIERVVRRGEGESDRKALLGDLVRATQKAIDDFQRGVEDKVKGSVGAVSTYAHLGRELDDIRTRLAQIEGRIDKSNE